MNLRGWSLAVALALTGCRAETPRHSPEAEAEGLYLEGTASYLRGDFTEALEQFEQVEKLRPDDVRLPAAMGEVYLSLGKLSLAQEAFRRSTERNPNRATSFSRLGRVLLLQGRDEEAAPVLQRAVELSPANVDAHEGLGELSLKRGESEAAASHFARAAGASSRGERREELFLRAASTLSEKKQLTEAAQLLEEAGRTDPRLIGLWTELGDLHVQRGDLRAAENAFRQGAQQGSALLWESVGEIALAQRRYAEAANAFRSALALEARVSAHVGLVRVRLAEGDRQAAEAALEAALGTASGNDAQETRELAETLALLGRKHDALSLLETLATEKEAAKDIALQRRVAQLAKELRANSARDAACARLAKADAGACP